MVTRVDFINNDSIIPAVTPRCITLLITVRFKTVSKPKLGNFKTITLKAYYMTLQTQPLRSDFLEVVGGLNPLIIASSKTDFMFF